MLAVAAGVAAVAVGDSSALAIGKGWQMHWSWPVEPRRRWRRWLRLLEQRLWEDQMHWQMHCYLVASCGGGFGGCGGHGH